MDKLIDKLGRKISLGLYIILALLTLIPMYFMKKNMIRKMKKKMKKKIK